MCGRAEVLTGWWLRAGASANAYQKVGPYPTSKILLRSFGGSKNQLAKNRSSWGADALLSHRVRAANVRESGLGDATYPGCDTARCRGQRFRASNLIAAATLK